jgi:hypothetical protein
LSLSKRKTTRQLSLLIRMTVIMANVGCASIRLIPSKSSVMAKNCSGAQAKFVWDFKNANLDDRSMMLQGISI